MQRWPLQLSEWNRGWGGIETDLRSAGPTRSFSLRPDRTMAPLSLLVLCLATLASATTVTLRVFSGTDDPSWVLSPEHLVKLEKMLATHTMDEQQYHIMGYTGFQVREELSLISLCSPSMISHISGHSSSSFSVSLILLPS